MNTLYHEDAIITLNERNEVHSFDDKPAIKRNNGDKSWYKEGKIHRMNGPAIELNNGYKYWFYEDREVECDSSYEFHRIINGFGAKHFFYN